MDDGYFKFASYYVIFDDGTGGCNVRFYDREGKQVKLLYFSWEKRNDHDNFTEMLNSKLDVNHKGNMRPSVIKIYDSDDGRTIGFFDRNDNLIYHHKYDGPNTLNEILDNDSLEIDDIIDKDYLRKTQKVTIVDQFDSYANVYYKKFAEYWGYVTSYF